MIESGEHFGEKCFGRYGKMNLCFEAHYWVPSQNTKSYFTERHMEIRFFVFFSS